MDQAVFLFDNQYDPKAIDKVYQQVKDTTWNHCINIQQAMMRQKVYGGPITDFTLNSSLNQKMGFPNGSYTIFLDERFIKQNQKYIMGFFMRDHNTISLGEILQDNHFKFQYTLQIGDYLYMEARVMVTDKGTYLIVIPDGTHGLTKKMWDEIMDSYGNDYSPNRWTLIRRPKVSYVYGLTTVLAAIEGNKLWLDAFTDKKSYYTEINNTDWKVAISDDSSNMGLLRMGIGEFKYDSALGKPYLELSDLYANYFTSSMSQITVFAYNEDRKLGYALSPNYIGPTSYLKTRFDEYIAAIDHARFKVIAEIPTGGWATVDGTDGEMSPKDSIVTVGFAADGKCWLSIPTKDGISPVNPNNFRIWEYDSEYDMLDRMVAVSVEAAFPNVYYYKLQSEASMLYIEWFRDDVTLGQDYDDFSKPYRDYIGERFTYDFLQGTLPDVIQSFAPLHSEYDASDFIKNILLYSTHEYRVERMTELLKETGLHYDKLVNELDAINVPYTTTIYDMAKLPEMYEKLSAMGENAYIIYNSVMNRDAYDIYVDGVRQANSTAYIDSSGRYRVTFNASKLTATSIIILDVYQSTDQYSEEVVVGENFQDSRIYTFPVDRLSGNDLVICRPSGARIDPMQVDYGVSAKECLIQVPATMVDWDALGMDINDPRIADRVGYDIAGGYFRSIVFRLVLPDHDSAAILKSDFSEDLTFYTSENERILVRYTGMIVTTEGYNEGLIGTSKFSKRIATGDICLHISSSELPVTEYTALQSSTNEEIQDNEGKILSSNDNQEEVVTPVGTSYTGKVKIYNANVYRRSDLIDLGAVLSATIQNFYGADDPNRILCFTNGVLQADTAYTGAIPTQIGADFSIKFTNYAHAGDMAQAVYLPFPVDKFTFTSNSYSQANLAGTGIMVIGMMDLVFENGYRIPNDKIIRVTNQIVKTPSANAKYTIIRMHRDSNLFDFQDTDEQSFLDKLLKQSPGFKQSLGIL